METPLKNELLHIAQKAKNKKNKYNQNLICKIITTWNLLQPHIVELSAILLSLKEVNT